MVVLGSKSYEEEYEGKKKEKKASMRHVTETTVVISGLILTCQNSLPEDRL